MIADRMRKFALAMLVSILGAGSAAAENLNLKYGPGWSCTMISAELKDLYESCRICERQGKHFDQQSSTQGVCVDKFSLKGNKYEEPPPDLARERAIRQQVDALTKAREAIELKRSQVRQPRDSGVSGSSRAPSAPKPPAQALPKLPMLDLLRTRTLVVPPYQLCDIRTHNCVHSKKPTTLRATADRKWLLVDDKWSRAAVAPMEPDGHFVNRESWRSGDLGEVIDRGETITTPERFILIVNEKARWTSAQDQTLSGGWDTRFVTTIDIDPSGNCRFRQEYTTTELPDGKVSTYRSQNIGCRIQ